MTQHERNAARILLVDDQGRVLLFRFARADGSHFWATPGGGLEEGESFEEAARRELREEVGVDVAIGLERLDERRATFTFGGKIISQLERYFIVRVASFELSPSLAGLHARENIIGHRWWSRAEIPESNEPIFPENLDRLMDKVRLDRAATCSVAVGWVIAGQMVAKVTGSDWRKSIHEKWQAPPEVLTEAVARAGGKGIRRATRLFAGESNEVHSISCVNGDELIVRISHLEEPHFLNEVWAMERCRQRGIPVPVVRLVQQVEAQGKKMSVSVQERLRGKPMDEWMKGRPGAAVEQMTREAGALLARLNSISCAGAGVLDGQGQGANATFGEYLVESLRAQDSGPATQAAAKRSFDLSMVERGVQLVEEHAPTLNAARNLLHGDYATKHIFIDGDEVTGIIDWKGCKSGDVALEIARWATFFDAAPHSVATLLEGYTRIAPLGPSFEKRLLVCRVRQDLFHLGYYDRLGAESAVQMAWRHLGDNVKRLEQVAASEFDE